MKFLISSLIISLSVLLSMSGCANFNYEGHVRNSMMLWTALGPASHDELSNAIKASITEATGIRNVREIYSGFTGEITWPDRSGKESKAWFEFDLGTENASERGFYFTAVYFAGDDSGSASAIDVNARAHLQSLLDDVQRRLGRHALKSANGVVIQ